MLQMLKIIYGILGLIGVWLLACKISPRFNRWSNLHGLPLWLAIVSGVALLGTLVFRAF